MYPPAIANRSRLLENANEGAPHKDPGRGMLQQKQHFLRVLCLGSADACHCCQQDVSTPGWWALMVLPKQLPARETLEWDAHLAKDSSCPCQVLSVFMVFPASPAQVLMPRTPCGTLAPRVRQLTRLWSPTPALSCVSHTACFHTSPQAPCHTLPLFQGQAV